MNEEKTYAYFYDNQSRTEAFCSITQEHNWGECETGAEKTARSELPKHIESFHFLEVEKRETFGSFLSNVLSMDFIKAMDYLKPFSPDEKLKVNDWRAFAGEASCLDVWGGTKNDVRRLYLVRKYVDICIECPRLYSFGQFEKLLSAIYNKTWNLKTLGFFAPAEDTIDGRYYIADKRKFNMVHYFEELDIEASNLEDLGSCFEHEMLDTNQGYVLMSPVVEAFEISNVVDVVLLSLFHLIQERTAIRRCANCKKLFVPLVRSDAIYCDRPSPQDSKKTCKEYGSKVLWYENVVNDDVAKLARNIYCAKQMLAKRNPDKPEYAEMFEYFKAEKKKWEQEVKVGEKTRDEFMEWLRKMKLRKTLEELGEL